MSRLLGPPVTVAPPKQEKKVFEKSFEKNYAFDSNDFVKNNDKEKVK